MNRWLAASALGALAGTMLCGAQPSRGQDYPSRPVRIITAGAGTFHDVTARQLAHRLSERWRQGVMIENQPAAGLTIGSSIAAKAAPDGYTLLLADRTALAVAPHLYKNLRYDPAKDFRPITLVARAPSVLVIHPSIPASSLREFVDYVRRQKDPVLYASAGLGTVGHLTGELFRQLAGIDFQIIQYKGGADAAMALLKGEAKFSSVVVSVALPQIEGGTMKALAVASARRFSGMPGLPTGAEAGLPGFESEQWVGMVAPASLPNAIAEKLNHDIVEVLREPAFVESLRKQGGEVAPSSPSEFAAFIKSESARLKALIEATGIRMD
jgi:tripartite-type tricarboxylate transporter receptor subunit TctC